MKTTKIWIPSLMLMVMVACEDILEVPDISEQQVTLLAPTSGSVLETNTVSFNWETVEEATGYAVQVATPNFENAAQLVLDSIVELDTLGYVTKRMEMSLFNGNYEWRVKAFNSDFETGYSSSAFQVNGDDDLDLVPPNTPQLIAPANGTSQTNTTVNFSWSRTDVPGTAERDSIFIFSDENLENLTTKALGANKTYSGTVAAGEYFWFVRAYDAAGNESDASNTFSFTIE